MLICSYYHKDIASLKHGVTSLYKLCTTRI